MKRALIVLGVILGLAGVVVRWLYTDGPLRDPQEALADFYAGDGRAEDMVMDPLILNGKTVVPLVMEAVANKQMEKRRYAICFLGNGKYEESLPLLERIVEDSSDIYYFRADALEAIAAISPPRAKEIASAHVKGERLLGEVATEIAQGKARRYCERSWWEAFNGYQG